MLRYDLGGKSALITGGARGIGFATARALIARGSSAGEAIARGIERRQARIVQPRRWAAMALLRGILGPLSDARLERDERVQAHLRQLDARAGEDQPTSA